MSNPTHAISTPSLKPDTLVSSHTNLFIGGLHTHVYGVKQAIELIQKEGVEGDEWVVLHLVHPRTRDYTYTETVAHLVLSEYYKRESKRPLIAVTGDLRNHGARMVNGNKNEDWKAGNETHAQDMVSGIVGSTQDVEMVIDFLPGYMAGLVGAQKTTVKPPTMLVDIVCGISQGGHVAWQVAATGKVKAAVPIIACPDLTYLLLHRRLVQANGLSPDEADARLKAVGLPLRKHSYHEIQLSLFQNESIDLFYPSTLHRILGEMDRKVLAGIDPKLPVLVLNSRDDPLVPSRFTKPWVLSRPKDAVSTFFEEPDVGHVLTDVMIAKVADFVMDFARSF